MRTIVSQPTWVSHHHRPWSRPQFHVVAQCSLLSAPYSIYCMHFLPLSTSTVICVAIMQALHQSQAKHWTYVAYAVNAVLLMLHQGQFRVKSLQAKSSLSSSFCPDFLYTNKLEWDDFELHRWLLMEARRAAAGRHVNSQIKVRSYVTKVRLSVSTVHPVIGPVMQGHVMDLSPTKWRRM